jgi:hypothetical protein
MVGAESKVDPTVTPSVEEELVPPAGGVTGVRLSVAVTPTGASDTIRLTGALKPVAEPVGNELTGTGPDPEPELTVIGRIGPSEKFPLFAGVVK